MSQVLIIHGTLPSLNQVISAAKDHRSRYAKLKREATHLVALECRAQKLRPVASCVRVACTWYAKDKRTDPDNLASAKKMILDGMTKAGVLPDDSWRWIRSFSDDFEVDAAHPRVEVRLLEAG